MYLTLHSKNDGRASNTSNSLTKMVNPAILFTSSKYSNKKTFDYKIPPQKSINLTNVLKQINKSVKHGSHNMCQTKLS